MSRPIPHSLRPHRVATALAGTVLALLAGTTPLLSQASSQEWLDRCNDRNGRRFNHCEIREARFAAPGRLEVSSEPNGSVDLRGSQGSEVHVVARVQAWADTEAEASQLAQQVQLTAGGNQVGATGPSIRGRGNRGWSVSYVITAPRRIDLDLRTINGGLSVREVEGDLSLTTTNGAIRMEQVGGSVRAHTNNGGVNVQLSGDRWQGDGLDLETTNGSIELSVPRDFAANLSARTVNGEIRTDFPVTVQGRIGRSVNAQLGGGGPEVRLTTTNGAIGLRRN